MRRHAWSLPLVAVCLLFAIATAHAECAWVSWDEYTEFKSARSADIKSHEWLIKDGTLSNSSCLHLAELAISEWIKTGQDNKFLWARRGLTVGISDADKSWTHEFHCLPDTVEPARAEAK